MATDTRIQALLRRRVVVIGLPVVAMLVIAAVVLVPLLTRPRLATGAAPSGDGDPSHWAPSTNAFVGTAPSKSSHVWFTGHDGILGEVFYPSADTPDTTSLQFLVGGGGNSWVDSELTGTTSKAELTAANTLAWKVTNTAKSGNYRIAKTIYTDPARDALVQDVTFTAQKGHVGDYALYVSYDPTIRNAGDHNSGKTVTADGRTMLIATDRRGRTASALAASVPYADGATSTGYVGVNDGLTDLTGTKGCGSEKCPDSRLSFGYSSATDGNIAQIGQLDLSNGGKADLGRATSVTFSLVLAFGQGEVDTDAAVKAAQTTLAATLRDGTKPLEEYTRQWQAFDAALAPAPVVGSGDVAAARQRQYYLAVNVLKAAQDKDSGTFVAGLGNPWGNSTGDSNVNGYHLVWARDLYEIVSALQLAGDVDDAKAATTWLFAKQQRSDGHFPQNSTVDGTPYWTGIQMDEQAFPLVLAWKTGLTDRATYEGHIRPVADYVVDHGPRTLQERWEENEGFSPSTIAAEIAGLVCAAEIARANGDTASAARYERTADDWQRNVDAWTYTTSGPLAPPHYERLDDDGNPNNGSLLSIGNGGGVWDEREIVDAGFLELVRLGVKRADDPHVLSSLQAVDATIRQTIHGHPYFFRYNHDGYGEDKTGLDYGGSGVGRLWPLLSGERGVYEIGMGRTAEPYLDAMTAAASPSGMIPEQIWDAQPPDGEMPGTPTRSMSPLSWSMAEYVTLLTSAHSGTIAGRPAVVAARYAAPSAR